DLGAGRGGQAAKNLGCVLARRERRGQRKLPQIAVGLLLQLPSKELIEEPVHSSPFLRGSTGVRSAAPGLGGCTRRLRRSRTKYAPTLTRTRLTNVARGSEAASRDTSAGRSSNTRIVTTKMRKWRRIWLNIACPATALARAERL